MSVEVNREPYLHLPISKCPAGITGYANPITEEQFLNDLADETDIQIVEADEFLKCVAEPTYALPETLSTLDWWKVFNQGGIGSCFGCADAQTATGVHWLATGQRVEFSKFGHYIATQKMGGMFGRDAGSSPTDGIKVAAKWGYCPEVWSEHLESLYKSFYNESSGYALGARLAPAYPRDYRSGIAAYRSWLEAVSNDGSKLRKVMHLFRMKTYIRVKKQSQIVEAKRKGIGFAQQSSAWPASMDSHPERIDRIAGSMHPRHGMHAYQILDINSKGECVIGNTWGKQWGDEGAKTASVTAQDQILADKYTICFLKTDMDFKPNKIIEPRRIPIKASDWV